MITSLLFSEIKNKIIGTFKIALMRVVIFVAFWNIPNNNGNN